MIVLESMWMKSIQNEKVALAFLLLHSGSVYSFVEFLNHRMIWVHKFQKRAACWFGNMKETHRDVCSARSLLCKLFCYKRVCSKEINEKNICSPCRKSSILTNCSHCMYNKHIMQHCYVCFIFVFVSLSDGLVVVGVHSAKFPNEKVSFCIVHQAYGRLIWLCFLSAFS